MNIIFGFNLIIHMFFLKTYVNRIDSDNPFNPFIPVSAKTATSQVDLQVWKG